MPYSSDKTAPLHSENKSEFASLPPFGSTPTKNAEPELISSAVQRTELKLIKVDGLRSRLDLSLHFLHCEWPPVMVLIKTEHTFMFAVQLIRAYERSFDTLLAHKFTHTHTLSAHLKLLMPPMHARIFNFTTAAAARAMKAHSAANGALILGGFQESSRHVQEHTCTLARTHTNNHPKK